MTAVSNLGLRGYVFMFVCQSVYLFVCLSVCLSFCLSVYMSVCLSVCLSMYVSVCMSVYHVISHPKIWLLSHTNSNFLCAPFVAKVEDVRKSLSEMSKQIYSSAANYATSSISSATTQISNKVISKFLRLSSR